MLTEDEATQATSTWCQNTSTTHGAILKHLLLPHGHGYFPPILSSILVLALYFILHCGGSIYVLRRCVGNHTNKSKGQKGVKNFSYTFRNFRTNLQVRSEPVCTDWSAPASKTLIPPVVGNAAQLRPPKELEEAYASVSTVVASPTTSFNLGPLGSQFNCFSLRGCRTTVCCLIVYFTECMRHLGRGPRPPLSTCPEGRGVCVSIVRLFRRAWLG